MNSKQDKEKKSTPKTIGQRQRKDPKSTRMITVIICTELSIGLSNVPSQ